MIDAYTIGITLALEDGVSDGILAIRRDLEALDSAVAESAGRLMVLRNMARDLNVPVLTFRPAIQAATASPAVPHQQRGTPIVPVEARVSDFPGNAQSEGEQAPVVIERVTSVAAEHPAAPVSANNQDKQAVVVPTPAAPTMVPPATATPAIVVQPDPPPPASMAPVRLPAPATTPTEPVRPLDFPTLGRSVLPAAKMLAPTPQPHLYGAERPAPEPAALPPLPVPVPLPFAQSQPIVTARWPAAATAKQDPFAGVPQASSRAPETQYHAAPPALAAPPVSQPDIKLSADTRRQAAAPVVAPDRPQSMRVERQPETRQSPANSADVDTSSQQTNRPMYAELHLDGAALGRWTLRHLEREITRPQAGATGFDPRMTPSWPGAPIGN
jgi:hypothetical protein